MVLIPNKRCCSKLGIFFTLVRQQGQQSRWAKKALETQKKNVNIELDRTADQHTPNQ